MKYEMRFARGHPHGVDCPSFGNRPGPAQSLWTAKTGVPIIPCVKPAHKGLL